MVERALESLFRPIDVGNRQLPHRIAMAPMTRFRCREDGVPEDIIATYYAQRAGAALILGESVYTHPSGRIAPLAGGLITDAQAAAWSTVAAATHAQGGRIFLQLIHGGRVSHPQLQNGICPVAPSAVLADDKVRLAHGFVDPVLPRALETDEIAILIKSFSDTTRRAAECGFDGVELHAANGYLPCQFLSSNTNLRDDAYGGSVARRCRFALDTLEEMIAIRGADFVGVKISPGFRYHDANNADPQATYAYLARALSGLGLAYVHVQIPLDFIQPDPMSFDPVALVRRHYRGVLFAGGNLDRYTAAAMRAAGTCDVAVFGRRFIANPDLPERIRRGAAENAWDLDTLHTPGARGFIDYPALDAA